VVSATTTVEREFNQVNILLNGLAASQSRDGPTNKTGIQCFLQEFRQLEIAIEAGIYR